MSRPQDEIPRHELDRLMGTDHWCEREGECRVQWTGGYSVGGNRQYVCSACLAIMSCCLTALGPAWWRTGTVAPSTDSHH